MNGRPAQSGDILAGHIAGGKQIVLAAAMVGDHDDYDIWLRRSRDWTVALGRSLTYIYGDEAAEIFQRATASEGAPGAWREALGEELDRVHGVVEMLGTLISELPAMQRSAARVG